MNPIPLTYKRRVYAYACGRCLTVPIVGSYVGYPLDAKGHAARVSEMAKSYKHQADACCRCSDCRAELAPGTDSGRCDPCEKAHSKRMDETMAKFSARDARRDRHNRKVMASVGADQDAARRLMEEMSEMSEHYYCAVWLGGLETSLWSFVRDTNGEPCSFGMGEVSPAEVENLRTLSEKARGWWRWDDDLDGPVFVPLDEWKKSLEASS